MHEACPHTLDHKDFTDCRDQFSESAIYNVLFSEFQPRRQGMAISQFIRELTRKFGPSPEFNISDRHHSSPQTLSLRWTGCQWAHWWGLRCNPPPHWRVRNSLSAMKPDGRANPQRLRGFKYSQTRGAGSYNRSCQRIFPPIIINQNSYQRVKKGSSLVAMTNFRIKAKRGLSFCSCRQNSLTQIHFPISGVHALIISSGPVLDR